MGVPRQSFSDLVALFEAHFGEELTETDRGILDEIGRYPASEIAIVLEEARTKRLSLSLAYARSLLRRYSTPADGKGGALCQ